MHLVSGFLFKFVFLYLSLPLPPTVSLLGSPVSFFQRSTSFVDPFIPCSPLAQSPGDSLPPLYFFFCFPFVHVRTYTSALTMAGEIILRVLRSLIATTSVVPWSDSLPFRQTHGFGAIVVVTWYPPFSPCPHGSRAFSVCIALLYCLSETFVPRFYGYIGQRFFFRLHNQEKLRGRDSLFSFFSQGRPLSTCLPTPPLTLVDGLSRCDCL